MDNKKVILEDIYGSSNVSRADIARLLILNFNEINMKFQSYKKDYEDDNVILRDILQLYKEAIELYTNIVLSVIDEFADREYGKSIDFILNNYNQESISLRLESFLKSKGYPQQFKCDVYAQVKYLADRLNKRFCFDDVALVNLIEAAMGRNIIVEADSRSKYYNEVLSQKNGKFTYKKSSDNEIYTSGGKKITGSKEKSEINISDFPMGNKVISSSNDAMKKVMTILFENLNLCIETYRTIYTSMRNTVENSAKLADGSTFDFTFQLNDFNIPHLLGFPKGSELSDEALNVLNIMTGSRLTHTSSALDVLLTIYNNQKVILDSNGLYEIDGKKYEIINWERVVLKTSSFMKGDFFKTCFCLAQIAPDRYLNDSKRPGGYVSISTTDYKGDLNTPRSSRTILYELLNARKQKRDYIFRGIYPDGNGSNYVYSIKTGKAETIRVGKDNELLQTLQIYRNLFNSSGGLGSSGGGVSYNMEQGDIKHSGGRSSFNDIKNEALFSSIVEEVANENFIRKFTPTEQAELALYVSRDLSIKPQLSCETLNALQQNSAVSEDELKDFENGRSKR